MSIKLKMVATGIASIAVLSGGTALYAQADKPEIRSGMMMHESGDRMNMMAQMNQMMENCNKMMQRLSSSMGADAPVANPALQKSK